jgi:hypothetical protein
VDPETLALRRDDVTVIGQALRSVPGRFRELLVLRELEGLSYRELADVLGIPIGTVMSGLSRARQAARRALDKEQSYLACRGGPPSEHRKRRTYWCETPTGPVRVERTSRDGIVFRRAVDVVACAKLLCQRLLVSPSGNGDGAKAHLRCELYGQVAQPADAENRHRLSSAGTAIAQRVERRDAGAHQGAGVRSTDLVRDQRQSFKRD